MKTAFWRGIFDRIQEPLYDTEGGGSGGGDQGRGDRGDSGQRDGGRSGGGEFREPANRGGQQRTGNEGGTGNERKGFKLAPDALVETEDGRVISFKDYQSELDGGYKKTYDGRYKKAYDLLVAEAEKIDQRRAGGQHQQRQSQTREDDPFADLDQLPIVDGRTAKSLVEALKNTQLKPIADLVTAMQRKIGTLEATMKGATSHIGTFNEERQSQEFESNLSKTLGRIDVKGLNGGVDANNEAIREIARNLYLSYDVQSWKAGEFEKMLGEQLSSMVQYIRAADKKYADEAGDRMRKNFNPRKGRGQPGGEKKFKFETPREIAARAREHGMFGGVNQT